ncbi:MAG: hypothetical protein GY774_33260 [Planctomycetes bacterium]|nr:hypothetical protein [Planctomycetota bacterium]
MCLRINVCIKRLLKASTLILWFCLAASAHAFVIDFDQHPVGTRADTEYFFSDGLKFNTSRIYARRIWNSFDPDHFLEALTGPLDEFHNQPLIIDFEKGQSKVRMRIGLNQKTYRKKINVTLTACDKTIELCGSIVQQKTTIKLPEDQTGFFGEFFETLEVSSGEKNIRRVVLQYDADLREVIDDLEFDIRYQPPADDQPPLVTITNPETRASLDTRFFALEGTVKENQSLQEIRLGIIRDVKYKVAEVCPGLSEDGKHPSDKIPDRQDYRISSYQETAAGEFTFGTPKNVYGILPKGVNIITVTAIDSSGNVGSDDTRIKYCPPPRPLEGRVDLFPLAIEVTQGINHAYKQYYADQLDENRRPPGRTYIGLPLVKAKDTIVRVYPGIEGIENLTPRDAEIIKNVPCKLEGFDPNGNSLGRAWAVKTLSDARTPRIDIDVKKSNVERRDDFTETWNFKLPNSWTQYDRITLRATVNPYYEGAVAECPRCNDYSDENVGRYLNTRDLYHVRFFDHHHLYIHVARPRIRLQPGDPEGAWEETSLSNIFSDLSDKFTPSWPISWDGVHILPLPNARQVYDGPVTDGLLKVIKSHMINRYWRDHPAEPVQNYPLSIHHHEPVPNNVLYGSFVEAEIDGKRDIAGLASRHTPVFLVARGSNLLKTIPHEIGHAFGLKHTPPNYKTPGFIDSSSGIPIPPVMDSRCKPTKTPINHSYPFYPEQPHPYAPQIPSINISDKLPRSSIGTFGVNTGNPKSAKSPKYTFDFMSYCNPAWISPYTWKLLLKRMEVRHRRPVEEIMAGLWKAQMGYIHITGQITTSGEAKLNPAYQYSAPGALTLEDQQGSYAVVLRDSEGQEMVRRSFTPDRPADLTEADQSFSLLVQFLPETHQISVERDGQVLVTKNVTESSPTVTLLYPNGGEVWEREGTETIRWKTMDKDKDPLWYTVQYSNDEGMNWQSLAADVINTELTVQLDTLPGSRKALVRVLATDGVNTGLDQSDAPFEVVGKKPLTKILRPSENSTYNANQGIELTGYAIDLEDGDLNGEQLVWYSDDGKVLGMGRRLDVDRLPVGNRKITLIVTDSYGNSSIDSVEVEVLKPPVQLQILDVLNTHVCRPGTSHVVSVAWRASTLTKKLNVGPISMIPKNGQALTVESLLPDTGSLVMPVNYPYGGILQVHLQAEGEPGDWVSDARFTDLRPCRFTLKDDKLPKTVPFEKVQMIGR